MSLSYKPLYESVIAKYEEFTKRELHERDVLSGSELTKLKERALEQTARLSEHLSGLERLKKEADQETEKMAALLEKIKSDLVRLDELNRVLCLLKLLERVKENHVKIERNLAYKSAKSTETEPKLLHSIDLMRELSKDYSLCVGTAGFFESYVRNVFTHWHDELRKRLEAVFEIALKAVNWPVVTPQISTVLSSEAIAAFQTAFGALLDLEMCSIDEHSDDNSMEVRVCLPLELMLDHLRKRFAFHFMRNSRTNQLEKPEWYFTQVLNWVKDHEEFLHQYADPIIESRSQKYHKAKLQLVRGLLEVVSLKLKQDLPTLVYDDKLFTHTFDEMLLFVREIEPIFQYNKRFLHENCKLLKLFTAEPYFTKVNNLERKKSVECIEATLNSNGAWLPLINSYDDYGDDDDDVLKVPECVDHFVLMLQSVTDRFVYFLDVSHRVAFMQLVLDLLDDFRLRLSQLSRVSEQEEPRWPFSQRYFSILNSLNYLVVVLNEWKTLPIFVEVAEYSLKSNIFDESVCYFNHMIKEMQTKISCSLVNQIRVKLYPYAKVKWFCFNDLDDHVDGLFYEILYFISSSMDFLQKKLAQTQFSQVCTVVIEGVTKVFMDDVILDNKFNEDGSHRLKADISEELIPLFNKFSDTKQPFFNELLEACKLLTLEYGTSLLLQEAVKLRDDKAVSDTLAELSIDCLSNEVAIKIFNNKLIQ